MADIKISGLPSTNVIAGTDLIVISKDMGGGNYESKKVPASNLALEGEIIFKADKVNPVVANNLAALDNTGNLTDSGVSKDFQKGLVIKDVTDPTKTSKIKAHSGTTATQYEHQLQAKSGTVAHLDDIGVFSSTDYYYPTNVVLFTELGIPYLKLATTINDPDYSKDLTIDILAPVVVGPATPQGNYIPAEQTVFGTSESIKVSITLWLRKASGTANVQSYAELYLRNGLGVETLIATFPKTANLTATLTEYKLEYIIDSIDFDAARTTYKFFADKVGAGTNPQVEFRIGGRTQNANIAFPITIENYSHDNLSGIKAAAQGEEHGHIDDQYQKIYGQKDHEILSIQDTELLLKNESGKPTVEFSTTDAYAADSYDPTLKWFTRTFLEVNKFLQLGFRNTAGFGAYLLGANSGVAGKEARVSVYEDATGEIKSSFGFKLESQFNGIGIHAITTSTYTITEEKGDQASYTINTNTTLSITGVTGDFNVSKIIPIKNIAVGVKPTLDASFGTATSSSQEISDVNGKVNRILFEKYKFSDGTEVKRYTNTVL